MPADEKSGSYKRYLLFVLLTIFAFNGADQLALGLMLQNIKADLGLSDTQLGALSGIAFALFYSLMGVPIARWADHGNRVMIISLAVAVWSVLVSLCGLAANFWQLLVIRFGVAIGESGCVPPAHSLIGDNFERAERPRAISIYMQGGALSTVLGYFLAGWTNQLYGWRTTFIILGLPGPLLAALAWFTLKEPRALPTPPVKQPPGSAAAHPTTRQVWAVLLGSRTFLHLLAGFSIAAFFANGIANWQPAFFARSFALKSGELGTWFAVIYGFGGMLGIYLGGEWASRRAARNEALQLRAIAYMYCAFGLVCSAIYLAKSPYVAFVLAGVAFIGGAGICGPLFAVIQALIPPHMRATAIAVVYLFANLIGMGLGPLASGALSDALRPWFGQESLRYALLILCPGYIWAAFHLWVASKTVAGDVVEISGPIEQATVSGEIPRSEATCRAH